MENEGGGWKKGRRKMKERGRNDERKEQRNEKKKRKNNERTSRTNDGFCYLIVALVLLFYLLADVVDRRQMKGVIRKLTNE